MLKESRVVQPVNLYTGYHLVLGIAAVIVVCALILYVARGNVSWPFIATGVTTLIFTVSGAIFRLNRRQEIDMLVLFSVCYALYNVPILLQFGFIRDSLEETYYFQKTAFRESDIYALALNLSLSSVFVGGYCVISALTPQRIATQRSYWQKIARIDSFRAGIVIVLSGLAYLLYLDVRMGGIVYVWGLDRRERFELDAGIGFSLPIYQWILAGWALTTFGLRVKRTLGRAYIFIILFGVWGFYNFAQGNRHLLLYSIIVSAAAWFGYRTITQDNVRRMVRVTLILYLVFCAVSNTRKMYSSVLAGEVSLAAAARTVVADASFAWLLPSRVEFAGPFFSLIDSLQNERYEKGKTYVDAILYLVPTRFYPGEKPVCLASQFAAETHQDYLSNFQKLSVGFGFHPIAEGARNFGAYGAIIGVLIPLFILTTAGLLLRFGFGGFIGWCCAVPQVVNMNRMSVDAALQELVYASVFAFVIATVIALFPALPKKREIIPQKN